MKNGMIFDIKKFAVHDGPGIRTTVFLKGCPLNCTWCHNPESRSKEFIKIQKETKVGENTFTFESIIGQKVNTEEVLLEVMKDKIFYDESNGGVTFSGGEPLMQPTFLEDLLQTSKERGLHTTIDTCGFATQDIIERILPYTDLFLYDLKLMDNEFHIVNTGVSNESILENLQLLISHKANIIIRIPLIPGITDTEENLSGIISFLISCKYVGEIDLLPFHSTAEQKYKNLEITNQMNSIKIDDVSNIEKIVSQFTKAGFSVSIGG